MTSLLTRLHARWPFLPPALALRLAHSYGTRAESLLEGARHLRDLGTDVGGGLTTREIDFLVRTEWAMTAEDILWRRSKLGLHLPRDSAEVIGRHLSDR
jgi:glycerol-3-phosphate dehydrogenase